MTNGLNGTPHDPHLAARRAQVAALAKAQREMAAAVKALVLQQAALGERLDRLAAARKRQLFDIIE